MKWLAKYQKPHVIQAFVCGVIVVSVACALVLAGTLPWCAHAQETAQESMQNGVSADAQEESQNENQNKKAVEPETHNYVNERQMPNGSFLYDTSIEALAGADVFYDNETVVVTGEVVGDRRKGRLGTNCSWITLYSLKKTGEANYTPASIEVYVSDSLADTIDTYGKYNTRGTYVQVSGTFHLVCADHEGLSDIHADSLTVDQQGAQSSDFFHVEMFLPGAIAVLAGLVVMFVHKFLTDRAR